MIALRAHFDKPAFIYLAFRELSVCEDFMTHWRAIGVCLLLGWPTAARAVDIVEYFSEDGRKVSARGTIQSENRTEVVVQTGMKTVTIPVWRIDNVKYDRQPLELATIRSRFDQGRFEEIITELKEMGKTLDEKSTALQGQLLFYIFRASAEWAISDPSRVDEAAKWYSKLIEGFPDSRFYFPANEAAGRMYLAAHDYANAAKAFGTLKDVDWPGYKEKALLYEGVAKLKQNQIPAAIAVFDAVLASPSTEANIALQKNFASAYKGEALAQSGKFAEAEKLLRTAIEAIPPDQFEVHAVAHNALGDALRAAKRPKEAILDGYMVVNVMFNRDGEQTARALFNLSELCVEIGQKDRAKDFATRLKTEYPNSSWTKKVPTN